MQTYMFLPGLKSDPLESRFVASVCHPVFFSPGASRHMELGENQTTGRLEATHSMNISRYLHIPPAKGEALLGQAAGQVNTYSPGSCITG
jgi:hypothetical protein